MGTSPNKSNPFPKHISLHAKANSLPGQWVHSSRHEHTQRRDAVPLDTLVVSSWLPPDSPLLWWGHRWSQSRLPGWDCWDPPRGWPTQRLGQWPPRSHTRSHEVFEWVGSPVCVWGEGVCVCGGGVWGSVWGWGVCVVGIDCTGLFCVHGCNTIQMVEGNLIILST